MAIYNLDSINEAEFGVLTRDGIDTNFNFRSLGFMPKNLFGSGSKKQEAVPAITKSTFEAICKDVFEYIEKFAKTNDKALDKGQTFDSAAIGYVADGNYIYVIWRNLTSYEYNKLGHMFWIEFGTQIAKIIDKRYSIEYVMSPKRMQYPIIAIFLEN